MSNAITLSIVLCLLVSSAGAVCMNPQPRLVCAEYFKEQTVVIARLVRSRYIVPKSDDAMDYHLYTMQAERVLRGRISPSFRIYEENSSGRAGFDWKQGESYLLFLSYVKQDQGWELDGCGNSGPINRSAAVLKEIERINAAGSGDGGMITGTVWYDPGVTVISQGAAGSFRTVSDKGGRFTIHVPAGIYAVHASRDGVRFVGNEMSYELPSRVRIEKGGCAQIRFDREQKGNPNRLLDRSPRSHGSPRASQN